VTATVVLAAILLSSAAVIGPVASAERFETRLEMATSVLPTLTPPVHVEGARTPNAPTAQLPEPPWSRASAVEIVLPSSPPSTRGSHLSGVPPPRLPSI
jgi:hypothetical protein